MAEDNEEEMEVIEGLNFCALFNKKLGDYEGLCHYHNYDYRYKLLSSLIEEIRD